MLRCLTSRNIELQFQSIPALYSPVLRYSSNTREYNCRCNNIYYSNQHRSNSLPRIVAPPLDTNDIVEN